jgi:adenylate cyclase
MAEERVQRRLAAILAADVVGYSRLVRADEEGTIAALKALRTKIIDPQIAEQGGRTVKLMGDGMLLEFPSVVDAVRAAVGIQLALAGRNTKQPDDQRIEFRIGINLGDVIIDGDDIHGDGVNVAARLEGLADPGGICIANAVFDQVRDRLDASFEDAGEKNIKNIDRPIRVWRWKKDEPRSSDTPAGPTIGLSVAVLPFTNLSGDPEQEYFSDGVSEDIITALSRARWFRVVSRNSSFAYKGISTDTRRVAEELDAGYVVEGSVRKAGNRVRITSELTDGATGNQIWAERYDRELSDIFEVQDEITRAIAGAIEPQLRKAEFDRASIKRAESLSAWDAYHRGLWEMNRKDNPNFAEALSLFLRAIELDPSFAPAYACAADAYFYHVHFALVPDLDLYLHKGVEAARHAIDLDDANPSARWALGRLQMKMGDYEEARAEIEKAIQLNPFTSEPYRSIGRILNDLGKYEEAAEAMERAIEVCATDPLSGILMARLAEARYHLGEYDTAIDWSRKALRSSMAPRLWGRVTLIAALGQKGEREAANKVIDELLAYRPEFSLSFTRTHYPIKIPEAIERYVDGLRKAGIPD